MLSWKMLMKAEHESKMMFFFCHKISKDALKNIVTTVSMSGCRAKGRLG